MSAKPTRTQVLTHQNRLTWATISLAKATTERKQLVAEAREAGLSFRQIGDGLGLTPEAAGKLYRQHVKDQTKGAAE